MKNYEIAIEIAGPTAMWTRPDTGDAPVSFLAPTFSGAKGIFASIWLKSDEVVLPRMEIWVPFVFYTCSTNYDQPLRSVELIVL